MFWANNSDLTLTFEDSEAYGAESGIVILKKIPKGHQNNNRNKQKGEESSSIPEFKPLKTDDSDEFSFKNIVGKFFHASTSLQPDETTDNDEITRPSPTGFVQIDAPRKPAPVVSDNLDDIPPPKTLLSNKKPNTFETVNYETHPELYGQAPESEDSNPFKLSNAEIDFLKNSILKYNNNSQIATSHTKLQPEYLPNIESFSPYRGELSADFIGKYGFGLPFPPINNQEIKTNTFDPRHKRYPHPQLPKHNIRFAPKRPLHRPKSPPINLVKSLTYELTPNGPIKV